MENKSRGLIIFALLELALLIFLFFIKINDFYIHNLWFSTLVISIGGFSLFYSHLYNLDSSFLYGSALLLFGACSIFQYLNLFSFGYFYPVYVLCVSIAHFAVFVRFRQFIHIKIFTILFFEAILLMYYKANHISFLLLMLVNVVYLVAILINVLLRVRKNLRGNRWKNFRLQKMVITKKK